MDDASVEILPLGEWDLWDLWLYWTLGDLLLKSPDTRRTFGTLAALIKKRARPPSVRRLSKEPVIAYYTLENLIDRCERRLGVGRLVIAEKKLGRIYLTEKGLAVYRHVGGLLEPLLGEGGGAAAPRLVKVRVADSIDAEVLPGSVTAFHDGRDRCRLRLKKMDYGRITDEILTGEFDLGIGWQVAGHDLTLLRTEPLGPEIPLVLVRSTEGSRDSVPWEERPFFLLQSDCKIPGIYGFLESVRPDRVVEVVNFHAVLAHVRHDHGAGVVLGFPGVLESLREDGGLEWEPLPLEKVPPQRITLYLPPGGEVQLKPAARAFLECVRRNVARRFGGSPARPAGPHRRRGEGEPAARPARGSVHE
jgi:DNA-binding transcriptional LysR family regulator